MSRFASSRLLPYRNGTQIGGGTWWTRPESLPGLGQGLAALDLNYKEAKKKDEYGNYFGYRGKVKGTRDADVSRWAWDVFLVTAALSAE